MLVMLHGAKASTLGLARYQFEKECDAEVLVCLPLRIGSNLQEHKFVVYRHELAPGRLLSKVQSWIRRHGGVYKSHEAMQTDVDILYRTAQEAIEKLEMSSSTSTSSTSGETDS